MNLPAVGKSAKHAILIGMIWLCLTILFEFGFGHYIMGNPWQKLLHDYNIAKGRVWSLFLVWITIAPFLFYKIFNRTSLQSYFYYFPLISKFYSTKNYILL